MRLRAEIDPGIDEPLDQRPELSAGIEIVELVAELEARQDLHHVGREAVEVGDHVRLELVRVVEQAPQRERRGVVEVLPRHAHEDWFGLGDVVGLRPSLPLQHRFLGRLEQRIEAANHRHRQDHVAVLAAHEDIAQDVVGDVPDEARDLAVLR